MLLRQRFLTENECYKAGRPMTPRGIMVHSTGANNPRLSRYVGPNDGYLGVNIYNNHWNQPRPEGGKQICCHAFIGKLADGKSRRAGRRPGQRIGGNLDTIAIEAIGPSKETEATTALLCAWLCREFGLDPALDIWQHWDFSGKNCPLYIRPHWGEFLTAVKGHMGVAPVPPKPAPSGSFQKGDAIVLNGPVFRDSYGTGQGSTFSNHESTITIVAPTTRFAPYHVGEIGWAKEKDLTKKEA